MSGDTAFLFGNRTLAYYTHYVCIEIYVQLVCTNICVYVCVCARVFFPMTYMRI